MKKFRLAFTRQAEKDLKQITPVDAKRILNWLDSHVDGCENPRDNSLQGKNLIGVKNGWRYKVGKYRILTIIEEDLVLVEVFRVGKRGDIYKK